MRMHNFENVSAGVGAPSAYGYSADGHNWTLSWEIPYECALLFTDGSNISVGGCGNRSQLAFRPGSDAVPIGLFSGAGRHPVTKPGGAAGEYTLFRPVNFKSDDDDSQCPGELLGNGICLPARWPPADAHHSHRPALPPYLTVPPAQINIDVGRQLFVDTFLIDEQRSTNAKITHHQPKYRSDVNPVLSPDKSWENNDDFTGVHFASAYSGGVTWDPSVSLYRIWYTCGPEKRRAIPSDAVCLAISKDGVVFIKPALHGAAVPGTNIVINASMGRTAVFLDLDEKDPQKRYKMSAVLANNTKPQPDGSYYGCFSFLESNDGMKWRTTPGGNCSGPTGDSSTVFRNPFRTPIQWVYSIKSYPPADASGPYGRARSYWESDELGIGAEWTSAIASGPGPVGWEGKRPAHSWTNADVWDPAWKCGDAEKPGKPGGQNYTQLYNLDAVAYESVLIGLFTIMNGKYCPDGGGVNRTGEWDNCFIGYSRDGFHWSRPITDGHHTAFLSEDDAIPSSEKGWSWRKAMVQSVGGCFTVQPSLLRFYVSGRSGVDQLGGWPDVNNSNSNASTGIVEMRRDGFASVSTSGAADAVLITRPIVFTRQTPLLALFLNAESTDALKVSVLDAATTKPLPGLTEADYLGTKDTGASANSGVRLNVVWRGGDVPLQKLVGQNIRLSLRFTSAKSRVYSFWVAGKTCGASWGFMAAGGAGLNSSRDLFGACKTDDTDATDGAALLHCRPGQNCTDVLQAAIDGAASTGGVVSLASGVWAVVPITLRSHLRLQLAAGTILMAQAGAYHDGTAHILSASSVTNLTVAGAVGGESRLVMRKADYVNTSYTHSEGRHAFEIMESTHVIVSDLQISDTGGDGVYIGGGVGTPSTDVELLRVTIENAYRNALSITSARDVVVRSCAFLNTSGTPPEAGVDLEPNIPYDWMNNISFYNMTSKFNHGAGFSVSIGKLQCEQDKCRLKPECMCPLHPPLVTITLDGANIQGASTLKLNTSSLIHGMDFNIGILVSAGSYSNGSQGWLNFTDVSVSDTGQPGLEIYPKAALALPATFTNCLFDGVATAPEVRWGGQNVPLLLHQSQYGAIGGFIFDNVTVRDGMNKRPWLKCDSCGSRGPALAISGSVTVQNSKRCTTKNVPTDNLTITCTRAKVDDSSATRAPVSTCVHNLTQPDFELDAPVTCPWHPFNPGCLPGGSSESLAAQGAGWLEGDFTSLAFVNQDHAVLELQLNSTGLPPLAVSVSFVPTVSQLPNLTVKITGNEETRAPTQTRIDTRRLPHGE